MKNTHLMVITGKVTVNNPTGDFWYSVNMGWITFRILGHYTLRDGDIIQLTGKIQSINEHEIAVRGESLNTLYQAGGESRIAENS